MRWLLPFSMILLTAGGLAGCFGDDDTDAGPDEPMASYAPVCDLPSVGEWNDPCTAWVSANDSPSKTEIDLVVNPADPNNIVVAAKDLDRAASDCVWSVAQVTKDGGQTWTTVYIMGDRVNRNPALLPFSCITDPIMTFGADGTLYYALQAYRAGVGPTEIPGVGIQPIIGSTFMLTRSLDGGLTWGDPVLAHAGDGPAVFHDYPRMVTNPVSGSIHTIWNGVGQAGVQPWVSTSRDQGESVAAPVTFAAEGSERSTAFASGFAATSDGNLYATAWTTFGQQRTLHMFESTDDAASFHHVGPAFDVNYPPRQRDGAEFRTPGFAELTSDLSGGQYQDRLYAIWTEHTDGQSDTLVAWSDDRGVTWSDAVMVNPADKQDQFFPRGKVDAAGTLHILHNDRSFDPNNVLIDMTHAFSMDGGATWTSQRLTATSFDGDLGVHQNGPPFIGDYNGIDVHGTDVYMAWGDTSNGETAEIAFAHVR